MRNIASYIVMVVLPMVSAACSGARSDAVRTSVPTSTPIPTTVETNISWPSDPTDYATNNEPLKRAWRNFERSQQYRLAQPSDRNLTPTAAARVKSNNPHQIEPFLTWWGAHGYRGRGTKDFLIAIVVDPSRSDQKRYGLVVFAAVISEGPNYKLYWVSREEDMESFLISPASGSVFLECFRRDSTEQTKELVWDKKSRQFRLI